MPIVGEEGKVVKVYEAVVGVEVGVAIVIRVAIFR